MTVLGQRKQPRGRVHLRRARLRAACAAALAWFAALAPSNLHAVPEETPGDALPYDLNQVRGIDALSQDPALREVLARTGFAIVPGDWDDVWHPYLGGSNEAGSELPPYITVDSAFRTYHRLLEYALSSHETSQVPRLAAIARSLIEALLEVRVEVGPLSAARERLLAWALVGLELLGEEPKGLDLPETARALASRELARAEAGARALSEIEDPPAAFDYGRLQPISFYTGSEELKRLYRAVAWFSGVQFRLEAAGQPLDGNIDATLVLASAVRGRPEILSLVRDFSRVYEAFLGEPDDLGLAGAVRALEALGLPGGGVAGVDNALRGRFRAELARGRPPRVNDQLLGLKDFVERLESAGQGVRLLPPRTTWESVLAMRMARSEEWQWWQASGSARLSPLHMLLALGDEHAAELLRRSGGPVVEDEVRSTREHGAAMRGALPAGLYAEALDVIRVPLADAPPHAPAFARTQAWRTKCTWSALAQWTCLRHAWALHEEDTLIVYYDATWRRSGFVDPYPEFFRRLAALGRKTAALFEGHAGLEGYAELWETLALISEKGLRNEALSEKERWTLSDYGESLQDTFADGADSGPLALVVPWRTTDIDSGGSSPLDRPSVRLYTGVGSAREVFVIRRAPAETRFDSVYRREVIEPGGLQLYRGAVMSAYEIEQAAGEPILTDESWRAMLRGPDAPQPPEWARKVLPAGVLSPLERLARGEWLREFPAAEDSELKDALFSGYLATQRGKFPESGRPFLERLFEVEEPGGVVSRLVELAADVKVPRQLSDIASFVAKNASPSLREKILAVAASGGRHRTVLAMACIDEPDAATVRRVLGDSDWARCAYVFNLKVLAGPKYRDDVAELERLARTDPSFLVRSQAMVEAGREATPPDVALRILRAGLADPSPGVRTIAALGMWSFRHRIDADTPSEKCAMVAELIPALWYVGDPAHRERAEAEAEELDAWFQVEPTIGLGLGYWLAGDLERGIYRYLAYDCPREIAAYDAASLRRDPRTFGGDAIQSAPELLQDVVVEVASDPAETAENRHAALRHAVKDAKLLPRLGGLLDDDVRAAPGGPRLADRVADLVLEARLELEAAKLEAGANASANEARPLLPNERIAEARAFLASLDPTERDVRLPGLAPLDLVCVDPQATGYATFQSHNQKVVSNARGIFMTHIRSRNEPFTAQTWRLSWSTDGGAAFRTLYEATHATNPPVLETDAQSNLYLVRPDFSDGNAYLYRFRAEDDYAEPQVSVIPRGGAGKFAMAIDLGRGQLYYFAHNSTFHVVGLDGVVRRAVDLLQPGPDAALQYPHLSLDRSGTLYAAWTTQAYGRYLYWDIHWMRSEDGGQTWRALGDEVLEAPITADDSGPADRVTLKDEFEAHTWLASFFVRGRSAHFFYLAQLERPRQHYVRYDLDTGLREVDGTAESGEQVTDDTLHGYSGDYLRIRGLDGFMATRSDLPGSTIYLVSHDATRSRIVCLASDDEGASWYDYAASELVVSPYAIGGARELSADGRILGSFTESLGPSADSGGGARVHFFSIPAGRASGRLHARRDDEGAEVFELSERRGQPAAVRFAGDDGEWSAWQPYAETMRVPDSVRLTHYQLRSRFGVVMPAGTIERE
jgi:hypothetical protein